MTAVSHPLYSPYLPPWDFSLFPSLKIKLKYRHDDTIEVIEAESLAVLNTLTEQYNQDRLKIGETLGTVHTRGRKILRK
jgi:hypothetical protein